VLKEPTLGPEVPFGAFYYRSKSELIELKRVTKKAATKAEVHLKVKRRFAWALLNC
jgi:hypothetical protein